MKQKKEALHKLEIQSREQMQKVVQNAQTVRFLIRWGALVCIAFFAYKSVVELAGKVTITDVSIAFQFLGKSQTVITITMLCFILIVCYALWQRKLKQEKIFYLSQRIKWLERRIDENRTSSQLGNLGETRIEDKQ